jgi:hypothetical protein
LETRYQIEANGEVYTVVDAAKTVYWAVITGAATDQVLGKLNVPGFAVEPTRPDLGGKAFADGTYAITAYPEQAFPKLASTSYTITYVLTAPGFRDFSASVTIPAGASFPVHGIAAAMRRLPVRIQGRVVNQATRLPIAGATVVSVDPPTPPAIHTSALRSALSFAHASGASAHRVSIAVIGSASLTQDAKGGDEVMNLTTRTGLAPGSILRLKDPTGVRLEYGVVDHLGPGAASTPGGVFLRTALNRSYPRLTTALDFVSATPVGAAASLSVSVDAGDGFLLASQLFTGTVSIESGGPLAEVHEVGALTDGDGFYGFDGIGGAQEIFLRASQGALQQTADWFVEYDQAINLVNFRL